MRKQAGLIVIVLALFLALAAAAATTRESSDVTGTVFACPTHTYTVTSGAIGDEPGIHARERSFDVLGLVERSHCNKHRLFGHSGLTGELLEPGSLPACSSRKVGF